MPPAEVIDLVSSPDVAIRPTRSAHVKDAAIPNAPPTSALGYDTLDLTLDDSPRPRTARRTTNPAPPVAAPAPVKRLESTTFSERDFSFSFSSSDTEGFDSAADLLGDPFDARPRKKSRTARLSPVVKDAALNTNSRLLHRTASRPDKSPTTSTSAPASRATNGWSASGVPQPTILRRCNANIEPIQTSSDPFSNPPRTEVDSNIIALISDEEVDVIASSPPLVKDRGRGKVQGKKATLSPRGVQNDQHLFSNPQRSDGKCGQILSPKALVMPVPGSAIYVDSSPVSNMASPVQKNGAKGKKKVMAWDHISSSAPEANVEDEQDVDVHQTRKSITRSRSDGGDFDLGDVTAFPSDSDDLPDLGDITAAKSRFSKHKSLSKATKSSTASSSKMSRAEIDSTKLHKLAAREAEKRRKQREKDEAKEQRRRERETATALAEVNKVRTDKKVSTPEMIVDLPCSFSPSLKLQVEALLSDLNVTFYTYVSPVKNVVKWRRKVKARFNDAEGHWEPIAEHIKPEKHALVIVPATEFVELALGAKGADLEAHVLKMQQYHDDNTLIYLIEGLTPFMRKNAAARNRQFQAAVRAAAGNAPDDASPPSTQQRKRKAPKPPAPHVDETLIEDALLSLQVHHKALIHHSDTPIETAQWVATFTQHISTIPYRRQRDSTTASAMFCMDSGQVRTGENAHDTYVKMLQEIARVTAPSAYGIASEFGTIGELVRSFERSGPLALEDVRKSANKDGAFSERCLGQAVSRRVCKVFTCRDENSTDI